MSNENKELDDLLNTSSSKNNWNLELDKSENEFSEDFLEEEKEKIGEKTEKKNPFWFFSKWFSKKEKSTEEHSSIENEFDEVLNEIDMTDDESLEDIEKKELEKIENDKKEISRIEKEAEKKAEKKVNKIEFDKLKYIDPKTLIIWSNIFLLIAIIFSYNIISNTIIPKLKNIEIYKMDEKKVAKDLLIVKWNLNLLEEERDQALTYRKLNYDLEQAVPFSDKYEDNIQVIENILKDSVSKFDKWNRYLTKIWLKPDVDMKDINIIDLWDQKLLWINYSIAVWGFSKYKYIKDFIWNITQRLKIFHVQNLSIVKKLDPKTKKLEYSLAINMYSYYRLPKLDEFWEPIIEEKEAIFRK